MRLGIGDTTEPIVSSVVDGLRGGVDALASLNLILDMVHPKDISIEEGLAKLYAERGLSLIQANFLSVTELNPTRQISKESFRKTAGCGARSSISSLC